MLLVDQHDVNDVCVVVLKGQASISEAQVLTDVIIPLAAARPPKLVFDLTELTFISSLSLGEMSSLAAALRKFAARLAIAGPSNQIRNAMHRIRLDHQYEIFETLAAAVAELGSGRSDQVAAGTDSTFGAPLPPPGA